VLNIVKYFLPIVFMYIGCGETSKLVKSDWLSEIKPPVLLHRAELPYPDKARKHGLEGIVGLYIYVTEEGNVIKSRIYSSSRFSILDEAAEEYVKHLKFKPAEKDNKPVGVWLSMDINYDLLDKESGFDIKAYLRKISRNYDAIESSQQEVNDQVFKDLIMTYQEYIDYVRTFHTANYYKELASVLDKKTLSQWKNYLELWPLTFILYYDFIIRYPESKYSSTVIEKMVILINEDVSRIIRLSKEYNYSAERISNFFKEIYTFLEENYPEHLEDPLKSDLEIYIE
jgi:TonB family protein